MKLLMLMLVTASMAVAQTNEVIKIKVTGDRVSLRAQPSLDGELLDRAMRGEEMVYFEQTNGWVAVQAPESLNFWVAAEFLKGGVVQPKKLNVRSGPSQNYNVVAIVRRDDVLTLRGEFNDWLKIAPPLGSRVWISEDYVERVAPPMPEPVIAKVEESENTQAPTVIEEIKPETKQAEPAPILLTLDKMKPQGKRDTIPGVLRRANPGLYKLVLIDGKIEETICLVKGDIAQMESFLNRAVALEGPVYWVEDIEVPVIMPKTIDPDPLILD